MTHMQIADEIRKAVKADPRPQVEIAKLAGLHEVNLSQFKKRTRTLPLKALVKLAGVVGMEIHARPRK